MLSDNAMVEAINTRIRPESKSVNRISYGVVFEYKQEVVLHTQKWSHVFIVKLPKKVFDEEQDFIHQLSFGETPAKALCMKSNEGSYYTERTGLSSCRRFEKHVKFLIDMVQRGYQNLHALVDEIYSLLPENSGKPQERVGR